MNTLLIFFAFPIAVIITSIILQKLLNNPVLVSALIFAIFLVITFAAFDETFLIATLAYTILAFITALITKIFCLNQENNNSFCSCLSNLLDNNSQNNENNTDNCARSTLENTRNETNNNFNYTYNRYKHY